MIETVQILRAPLAEFYDSLTDEDRRRLDALPTSNFVGAIEAQGLGATAWAATL